MFPRLLACVLAVIAAQFAPASAAPSTASRTLRRTLSATRQDRPSAPLPSATARAAAPRASRETLIADVAGRPALLAEVDDLLNRELRKTDDLLSNILLLIRATGMRVGECLGLKKDCLHHLGDDDWALHVPLGKLHNERLVPIDDEVRRVLDRIVGMTGSSTSNDPGAPLFTLNGSKLSSERVRKALKNASQRAHCQPVRPHQLRHTYATMMLRSGISLPALKEILGHRDIKMTMRYVQVTQADLQREYLLARRKMETIHPVPQPSGAARTEGASAIAGICNSLEAIRHQLEMYRRQFSDQSANRKLHSLLRSLVRLRTSLAAFHKIQKL